MALQLRPCNDMKIHTPPSARTTAISTKFNVPEFVRNRGQSNHLRVLGKLSMVAGLSCCLTFARCPLAERGGTPPPPRQQQKQCCCFRPSSSPRRKSLTYRPKHVGRKKKTFPWEDLFRARSYRKFRRDKIKK